jgi:hypothetical protein
MKTDMKEDFLAQLDAVERVYVETAAKSKYEDQSDLRADDVTRIVTIAKTAVERISGKNSPYAAEMERSLAGRPASNRENPKIAIGIVRGLKHDLAAGYLKTLEDMLYGEIFADIIEMSSYLIEEGYKDPAAVVAGGALEQHLRKLCRSNGIDTTIEGKESVRPKKAEQMNSDLASKNAISKLDQKSVTAWLDVRNKAAHAQYDEYTRDQVSLMIAGIRDFITRTLT